MKLKRVIACLLAAATLTGLLVLPQPVSAAGSSTFTDITDPQMAEAAEILRLLGVVDGTGGTAFNPGRTLTRAEFCKMVIEIMGKGGEEPAQRSRTIFLDVKSDHWARGYINLAASTDVGGAQEGQLATKLIMGAGDGNFYPERTITYGEAVTILMRVLGYSNSDVATGASWYDGYVAIARSSGLADGLSLGGASTITRGQAALLFYNLLFTTPKGSGSIYLESLGGKKQDGGILLSVDAAAADGTKGAVKTTTGTYKTDRATLDASLEGMQGELLLDKDGKLLAFQAAENVTRRTVNISGSPRANYILTNGAERLDISPQTEVYKDGVQTTYEAIWQDLTSGTPLSFYYSSDGRLEYIFYQTAARAETAAVARSVPNGTSNPFYALVRDQSDYQIYKNGISATVADIRQYDVATYDAATRTLNISDLRLTGIYENVYPNTESPATITMFGTEFPVLSSAVQDLQNFRIGEQMTLLFTQDGQVAGVVSTSAAKSTAVGVVKEIDSSGNATVELLNDVIGPLHGKSSYTEEAAEKMLGQLVTVASSRVGQISLARYGGNANHADLNVAAGMLGYTALAENVRFFERVGNGTPREISREQITCLTVPASKIQYVGKDYAGKVNILLFDDVTGDLYTYGILNTGTVESSGINSTLSNPIIWVTSDGKTASDGWTNERLELIGVTDVRQNAFGGIAASLDIFQGYHRLAGCVTLTAITGVRRSAFDMDTMTVTTTDMVLPISPHVVCYNRATSEHWFTAADPIEALNLARAYSDNLTIYYDKAPEDGGKVRIVVVE